MFFAKRIFQIFLFAAISVSLACAPNGASKSHKSSKSAAAFNSSDNSNLTEDPTIESAGPGASGDAGTGTGSNTNTNSGGTTTVPIPGQATCGTTHDFKFKANSSTHKVYKQSEQIPWHKWNPCLKDITSDMKQMASIAPNIAEFAHQQIVYLLSRNEVRLYSSAQPNKKYKAEEVMDQNGFLNNAGIDRVVYTNNAGVAYDSMGHMDLTLRLFVLYEIFASKGLASDPRAQQFKRLAYAVVDVVADKVDHGGLRSRSKCSDAPDRQCSWFHSVTSRDRASSDDGATLNKMLHAIRDFLNVAEAAKNLNAQKSASYIQASLEGLNQLMYSKGANGKGALPNLLDFIPRKANDNGMVRAWAYYSFNPNNNKFYYLNDNLYKNCTYHLHDLELMAEILKKQEGALGSYGRFFKPIKRLKDMSVLEFLINTYQVKLSEGLYSPSAADKGGNFSACQKDQRDPVDPARINYLLSLH